MDIPLKTCTLRQWRASDLDALVRHANNIKVADNLRDQFPHPYTEEAGRMWLEVAHQHGPRWAVDVAGEACGGIGLMLKEREERRTAEIGYWLGEALWGRGIMTEAVGAVTDWAFRTYPDLLRLEAEVGYEIDAPLPAPPVFELIRELGDVPDEEMREVFNMGCGFCCVAAAADADAALELLRGRYPDASVIGRAVASPRKVRL